MVRIRLSGREFDLLKKSYENNKKSFNYEYKSYLEVESDLTNELENIINIINDYFLEVGLQKDSEPNKLGL